MLVKHLAIAVSYAVCPDTACCDCSHVVVGADYPLCISVQGELPLSEQSALASMMNGGPIATTVIMPESELVSYYRQTDSAYSSLLPASQAYASNRCVASFVGVVLSLTAPSFLHMLSCVCVRSKAWLATCV